MDTNVASELRKPRPHGGELTWLRSVDDKDLFLAAVAVGEIPAGIELTREEDVTKAALIEAWLEQPATSYNMLAMDAAIFRVWARLMHRRADGLVEDAMIAATASVHGLIVVTRNVGDFKPFGVPALNPFKPVAR